MRLTNRRAITIFQIGLVLLTLSLQACTNYHQSIKGETISNLKVKMLWPKCESDHGHIAENSKVYITHAIDGTILKVKFKKFGFWNKGYTFTITQTDDLQATEADGLEALIPTGSNSSEREGLNFVTLKGIQDPVKGSQNTNGDHKIDAVLVKIKDKYVAIDFDYWDIEESGTTSPECDGIAPDGHGRGGGGGWN